VELEHEFTVPVPVDQAWEVLLDVEKVAPCMPGAVLDTVDDDSFTGQVKVKVGPITVAYKGTASFLEKDAAAHRAVVEAKGRETRGSGTAAARVTASMVDEGGSTRVAVVTDLAITGKPAQFGRGVMNDVGNKLIGQFADCLATTISAGGPAEPAGQPVAEPHTAAASSAVSGVREQRARPTPEAIDLVAVAGGSVAKRLAPAAAILAVLLVGWILVRRRRR
jgi:carbon monoxide dehydrogenase subunit G